MGLHPSDPDWFHRRTSAASDWALGALVRAKGTATVSVVLPALDEEATVGSIVGSIRRSLMDDPRTRLVDELVVLDSGSVDDTALVAAAAGARVVARGDVRSELPPAGGKGEAMWRGLAATSGDIVVFIDADLRSFTPEYVSGLLGPLLTDSEVSLVKALYDRPMVHDGVVVGVGGRVTELVARPLLNMHWPQLAEVVQPLAGEYAARRSLLERMWFPTGYGVDLAILVQALQLAGLEAIAQVDLGVRIHRHHDELRLGRMAAEIWRTALDLLEPGRVLAPGAAVGSTLVQFEHVDGGLHAAIHDVSQGIRPPLAGIPDHA